MQAETRRASQQERPCWQVHLTVDTAMETGTLGICAFVARKMVLADRVLARHFQEVDCEVRTAEVESVGGECTHPACSPKPCMRVFSMPQTGAQQGTVLR